MTHLLESFGLAALIILACLVYVGSMLLLYEFLNRLFP